jgi:hypothetical protein
MSSERFGLIPEIQKKNDSGDVSEISPSISEVPLPSEQERHPDPAIIEGILSDMDDEDEEEAERQKEIERIIEQRKPH